MNESHISIFRDRLAELQADLKQQNSLGLQGQATVTLDQQSVGRLSRMDALQNQAMARATQARRDLALRRIQAAFTRIDEGEFGFCTECGEEIAQKRLELDPATPLCLNCAKG